MAKQEQAKPAADRVLTFVYFYIKGGADRKARMTKAEATALEKVRKNLRHPRKIWDVFKRGKPSVLRPVRIRRVDQFTVARGNAELVYTDDPGVKAAYEKLNIPVEPITKGAK